MHAIGSKMFNIHHQRVAVLAGLLLLATSICLTRVSTRTPPASAAPNLAADRTVYLPHVAGDAAFASWSTPIAVSPRDGVVWVVNPDAGSISALDPTRAAKIAEVALGGEPWSLAIAPDGGSIYVVDRAAGILVVVDALKRQVRARLPVGPEPIAVALSPTGARAYVTISSAAHVAVVETARLAVVARVAVEPHPYAIAVTGDGARIYVTHLLAVSRTGGAEAADDGREGHISIIDAGTQTVSGAITLAPDEHGFPNLLAGVAIANGRAWVAHLRAAPALPQGLTTTVFAAVSAIDLERQTEDRTAQLPLNDQEIFGSPVNNPVAAIPAPDGATLYIVLAGSDLVAVVDISTPQQPRLVKFLPTGRNPRGLALSRDGRRGYVMSYLSRSVSILDLAEPRPLAEVRVAAETLAPQVLRGKIVFNSAADPRLSQGSWVSCASCHLDSGSDGVTWMFPDGPRQTPPLWNATQTLPWHWSAALDESQDVEQTIQLIQHGLGLAPGADPPQLGRPNAGRAADLDALAAFLARGIRVPAPAQPQGDLTRGRALFRSTGCMACHGGPNWSSSALPGAAGALDPDGNGMVDGALRDVGTLNPRDLRGATGFDPPSLLGVGLTAPYLHDGSLPTLDALLASGHPEPDGDGNGLSEAEIAALVAFLRAIGPSTPPIEDRR
jgi:YVTN family beta-propeller protein